MFQNADQDFSAPIKVLIIEDFESDRLLYRRYLKADNTQNYQVFEAEEIEDIISIIQSHKPDIILLDYWVSDSDSLTIFKQLQQQNIQPFPAVIMMTGQGNEEIAAIV